MTIFNISQMDRLTADGFVCVVHWTASQTDGDFSASTYSTASFTEQPDQQLIPYADLTEAIVIQWVKDSLGEEGVAALEAGLDAQIEAQRNPTQASGTPWSAA